MSGPSRHSAAGSGTATPARNGCRNSRTPSSTQDSRPAASSSWTTPSRRRSPMPELPTGTVTFVFTDVEGSTRLLSELGSTYADALAEHRGVVREAVARHGGV